SSDATLRLWDAEKGTPLAVLEGGDASGLESVVWSPDGNLLATSAVNGTIRLWDVKTLKVRHVLTAHTSEIDSTAFSPGGKTLASGCKDKTLRFWDVQSGSLKQTLTGFETRIESLAYSPDGKLLAAGSGGAESLVRLWNVAELKN